MGDAAQNQHKTNTKHDKTVLLPVICVSALPYNQTKVKIENNYYRDNFISA